ncbi:MAG: glycoside hydrolase family 2 protein [Ignavibacteriales bacterium]|nr:MAG: glycoside hydrolase family 2 protein [Ignavibacteriales bacterium]
MKTKTFNLLWAIFCFTYLATSSNLFAQQRVLELNQNWKFHQAGKAEWYNASVPGCVHTDLLDNALIPDPFYRTNEKDLQWIDKADWEYETTFYAEGIVLEEENIELIFKGLDTYADVFLNDNKLLSANNMFREWNADCKSLLKQGENKLRILFHSPIKRDLPKLEKLGYDLPAVNDQSENGGLGNKRISMFARKAPYHYGWDWGPRFVTSGIWRPIYLKAWSAFSIKNIQIVQTGLTKDLANLIAQLEVYSNFDGDALLLIKDEDKNFVDKKIKLIKGLNKISASFQIDKPNLWWPNGIGEQYLYNFTASIKSQNKSSDEISLSYGLRTVEVVQEEDSIGRSFYFKVNGIPVFMKGANYIPSDNFLNRVTPAEYEKIVRSAADANMNMLRVWGGGIYENDIFYELCDKYGILIWHDFMFACSMYPGDYEFFENVKQEAIDNVKRLRSHPSIALWCGNNEMEDAWAYWGWKQSYNEKQQKEIYNSYKELFFNIIPSVVKEYDGTRFYWPSSPSSEFGRPSKQESGDLHYWGVWHGKEPFENFQTKIGRFVSEYGFQSFPEFKTVQSYTTPEDWDIESEVMAAHQRSGIGNLRIRDYLNMYYKSPKDFTSFLYVGQVLQAYGIKQAIEAHRRARPVCMGTLFWQIDDCWPVASWSSMDYYKRWKAMHYIAKKAYEPLIISPILKDDVVNFTVVNDYLDNLELELFIEVYDFNGNMVYSKPFEIKIDANSSKEVLTINKSELTKDFDESRLVLVAQLRTQDKIAAENLLYFKQPKDLSLEKPDIKLNITGTDNGYSIELVTDKLAKNVYLSIDDEGFFSDNYFDLLPGTVKYIELKTNKKIEGIESKIKVVSLMDSY